MDYEYQYQYDYEYDYECYEDYDEDMDLDCDESFDDGSSVESDEQQQQQQQEQLESQYAQQPQYEEQPELNHSNNQALVEESARIALEDLDIDMTYRCMLRQELSRPDYSRKYEYLRYRRVLVDWMCEVGEEMQIRKGTVHTAIAYLERVLSMGPLPPKDRFQLLALSCLLIAAKYLGPEEEVPPMAEFWEFGNRCYTIEEIHKMEMDTLNKLGWSLTALSPIHFVRFYLSQPVLFTNDEIQGTDMVEEALEYYRKYADFFVDLCLQSYQFQAYRPSLVAASILAASRKALGMSPLWREELTELTGYSPEQVEPCFIAVWTHYVKTFGDKSASEKEISPTGVAEFPEQRCLIQPAISRGPSFRPNAMATLMPTKAPQDFRFLAEMEDWAILLAFAVFCFVVGCVVFKRQSNGEFTEWRFLERSRRRHATSKYRKGEEDVHLLKQPLLSDDNA
ncbi:hypothetical protein ATCC90586_009448 [Pythium insidiosum]|nr:hypothetical protein ATCC90586_009448 [Pythium insidiosum]